jgi:hypothetical protein
MNQSLRAIDVIEEEIRRTEDPASAELRLPYDATHYLAVNHETPFVACLCNYIQLSCNSSILTRHNGSSSWTSTKNVIA